MEYLLTNTFFHADALEFAENMLTNLKCTLQQESQERMEQIRRAMEYFKPTKFASIQGDTSSGSSNVSGLASMKSSHVSDLSGYTTDTESHFTISDIESD